MLPQFRKHASLFLPNLVNQLTLAGLLHAMQNYLLADELR